MENESFAKWKGESFECQRCGACCYRQTLIVSTTEINAILSNLKIKNSGEFEQFILDSCTFSGRLIEYSKELEEQYRNTLLNFYEPFVLDYFEEATIVRSHAIHFYPSSKRCVFHNPLETSCFIYPARPLTCRVFPFGAAQNIKDIDYEKSCPGIGRGLPPNERKLHRILEMYVQLLEKDKKLVDKYVKDKKLKPIKMALRKEPKVTEKMIDELLALRFNEKKTDDENSFPQYCRKLVDPYTELQIIPSSIMIEVMQEYFDNEISQRKSII